MKEINIDVLKEAAENIRVFHQKQLRDSWFFTKKDGSILGQKITPIDSVGCYAPGAAGDSSGIDGELYAFLGSPYWVLDLIFEEDDIRYSCRKLAAFHFLEVEYVALFTVHTYIAEEISFRIAVRRSAN